MTGNTGFSFAKKTVLPVIDKGPYSYAGVNVEAQRRDPNSLLNWMTDMIRLRKECPEIGWGDWRIFNTGSPNVLGMRYDWRGTGLIVVNNFDEKPHEVRIKSADTDSAVLVNLMANNESHADERGIHRIALEAYGYRWYRVGNLNHVLQRSRV